VDVAGAAFASSVTLRRVFSEIVSTAGPSCGAGFRFLGGRL
jgi:hypothetical protein